MVFDVFLYTNQGGRAYNEDSVGFRQEGEDGVFVVADGLGGHRFGEVASACVKDVLLEGWHPGEADVAEWIRRRIADANRRVLAAAREKNSVLKSTVVALAIEGGQAVWANVGDSRLYYLHGSRIERVTEDHSVAYKKYKAGEITREQIGQDEDQSCLLRAVGSEDRNEPDVYVRDGLLEAGDAFLLCTDGVWEYLKDEEILIDLLKAETAEQWAELLLLRVMGRIDGENDNLTLLTLMLKQPV